MKLLSLTFMGSAMDFSGELESPGIPDMSLHIEQAMRFRDVEKMYDTGDCA